MSHIIYGKDVRWMRLTPQGRIYTRHYGSLRYLLALIREGKPDGRSWIEDPYKPATRGLPKRSKKPP